MHRTHWLMAILIAALPAAAQQSTVPPQVKKANDSFTEKAMEAHIRFLASDLLEGRGPGTRGDRIAMEYIASQFREAGLEPDGDDGSYFQKVSLLGVGLDPAKSSVSFTKAGGPAIGPLQHLVEYVGGDQTQSENTTLDSEVIFVGHGVEAPEYRWDDYKGVDTRGKTLIMLVDDPPATASEPDLFKGKARTYYGRWTYKYEMGAAKNADAVILIHTNEAAGYGWQVVSNSWGGERSVVRNKPGEPQLKFAGWISQETAAKLFQAAGYDLQTLTNQAHSRDFKPVSLGFRFTGNAASKIRTFDTANVVAKVRGSDPKLRDEAILYSAHHDHLGIGKPDDDNPNDTIYNGAVDNATGTALLIEMAKAWAATKPAPKRSIIFAAVAAEEQGLLGSAYYGQNPTIPAGKIALNLNFDAIGQIGRVKNVTMTGVERTTFHSTAKKVTKAMGLRIDPDPAPEQGSYYRSDHFSLGKVGIPAFSIDPGHDVAGKPADFGAAKEKEYRERHYHQPSDEVRADWDYSSNVQMAELGYWLGWEAANAASMPNWVEGDEFRAVRDRSLGRLTKE